MQEHEGLKVVKVEHDANKGLIEKYKVCSCWKITSACWTRVVKCTAEESAVHLKLKVVKVELHFQQHHVSAGPTGQGTNSSITAGWVIEQAGGQSPLAARRCIPNPDMGLSTVCCRCMACQP